jgi:hypothetical protein
MFHSVVVSVVMLMVFAFLRLRLAACAAPAALACAYTALLRGGQIILVGQWVAVGAWSVVVSPPASRSARSRVAVTPALTWHIAIDYRLRLAFASAAASAGVAA